MIVSYNWLKTLVKLDGVTPKDLVRDISLYSVEVEGIHTLASAEKLVIGHVLEKVAHPSSDHLSVCQVDVGDKVLQIVCGAPNVGQGQKVMVVLPGGHVSGHPIKEAKIRGVESFGMICSLQEIGLEAKYIPSQFANGIYVLPSDAPVGEDALKYLGLDDVCIELGLTPNRMDLLSMVGVARDVNAIYRQGKIPFMEKPKEISEKASDLVDVKIATDGCYTYYAKVIKDVEIKESPLFIKQRLIASGIRPINNVVDITNYILMLFGQPLHAFDQAKLGSKILVRNAFDKEKIVSLDNVERTLCENDIVITDGEKPVAIAGVMGGLDTEVTDETKTIVLEGAVFNPLKVRATSGRLGLRSESSVRFERGVDLNTTLQAMEYACYLLEKYACGKVLQGFAHAGIDYVPDKVFTLTARKIGSYLGVEIKPEVIEDILLRLDFKVKRTENTLEVKVPNRRLDITDVVDLIEEIARIYGYHHLKETLPESAIYGEKLPNQVRERLIEQTLINLGLNETITYSLVSPKQNQTLRVMVKDGIEEVKLLHPMSEEQSVLRLSLAPSLLEVAKYNSARQITDFAFFEIGKRYYQINKKPVEERLLGGILSGIHRGKTWDAFPNKQIDFFYVKGLLENLFGKMGIKVTYEPLQDQAELHPGKSALMFCQGQKIGYLGALHPRFAKANDLDDTFLFEIELEKMPLEEKLVQYHPIAKVPTVERDLAFVTDIATPVGKIIASMRSVDQELIKEVIVFDLYTGENIGVDKKSVAFRVVLAPKETLTEDKIQGVMKKIIDRVTDEFALTLRK